MTDNAISRSRLTGRISFKLARVTVLAAFMVGLIISGLQVYLDYFEAQEQLDALVAGSLQAAEKPATRSVLLIDTPLANEVISGLFEYDYIAEARILDDRGGELAALSRTAPRQSTEIAALIATLTKPRAVYERTLALPARITSESGSLQVVVDRTVGLAPFFDRAVNTLTSGFIHSVILALVLYIAFHRGITRPLSGLVEQLSRINPEQPGENRISVSERHQQDELGKLTGQINQSYDAIQELVDSLRSTNKALKTSEETLRRRSWELEQEVERTQQTTLELIATKEQAETANRAKSAFLANVSHELRTPLNAIIGFSSIMSEEMFGPIGHQRYRAYLGDIRTSSEHLSDILGEVLDLAKIEAGQIKLEEEDVDIGKLCEQSRALMSGQASVRNVELLLEIAPDLPDLYGDRLRIKQSVLNLVSNAIKFSSAEAAMVTLRAFTMADGALAIQVEDNGIGIAASELELIFTPFMRSASAHSRSHDGTGLGLALVKSFTDEHDGRVEVESEVGRGSRFTLIYPAERVHRPDVAASGDRRKNTRQISTEKTSHRA